MSPSHTCPFREDLQLTTTSTATTITEEKNTSNPPPSYLPGHPRRSLQNRASILAFLESDLCSTDLETIAPRLWYMSKQDSANISPLHRQRVKGRQIVITEDQKLHLTWFDKRIFIKRLPAYLTNRFIWDTCLQPAHEPDAATRRQITRLRRCALGYLRSWFHLVQWESDFRIAREQGLMLIPGDEDAVSWDAFSAFSGEFGGILDREVSRRYMYGEIRLARLNFYAPISLGKWSFHRVQHEYHEQFGRICRPWFFVFGTMTVVLSGLQVVLTVEQQGMHSGGGGGGGGGNGSDSNKEAQPREWWMGMSFRFGLVTIMAVTFLGCLLLTFYVGQVLKEWHYAIRDRFRVHKEKRYHLGE